MKQTALNLVDKILNDVVTLASIGTIGYLALNGITDPVVISVVAGLGGYSVKRRGDAANALAAAE